MDQILGPQSISVVGGLLIILATGARGMWAFSFQTNKELAAKDEIIKELRAQLEAQRLGSFERLDKTEKDRDEWKNMALGVLEVGKRTAAVAEKSTNT